MLDQTQTIRPKSDVDGFDTLVDLALNLRWSWSHGEEQLWEPLDPELWELTHNPWLVLQTVSHSRLRTLMSDSAYRQRVDEAAQSKQKQTESATWFQNRYGQSPLTCVAYAEQLLQTSTLPGFAGRLPHGS